MGKIIKNGVEYSSAVPNLTNILHTELDAYTAEMDEKLADAVGSIKGFFRVTTQTAGYLKFRAMDVNEEENENYITLTDHFGGHIEIYGGLRTQDSYKSYKAVRTSWGDWNSFQPTYSQYYKMEKLYLYDGYLYLKVPSYTTVTFTGILEKPEYVETLDDTTTEIPIVSLFNGKAYTLLAELGLTSAATVDNVLSKLQPGETFTAGVTQFTNYQTLFPYDSSNDQYSRVFIQQGTSQATAYVKWFRKDGSREALANLDSNNKVAGWNEHTMNEIIHTSLTESLSGITTTLDLINALITEYRAKQKPVKFISGSITKTQLTDLPSNYGLLDITVAGYDLVEVRFAQSEYGFKKMHYGYLNRTSSETLFSSLSWKEVNTNTILVTNTSTLKLDITKKNSAYYGAIKIIYLYSQSPVEIEIDFRSVSDTLIWTIANGQKYVKNITYTQDASNKAHYTIGIEFSGTTYGCYQAEVIGGFADINSLTGDAFTGDTTAVYGNPYGKNNGVTLVSAPEDLGLTSPCTTVQLVQAMRNAFNKTITSGAIGVFNNGGNTITDAPSDYGLLHIECFGHDRMLIRYDGIGGSTYAGSWIGRVKGSNGTFSEVTFERENNIYSTGEEVIGTWIDGSTIYRKVISLSNIEAKTSSSTVTLGEAPVNQQYIIKIEGYMNLIGNQYFINYPNITGDDDYIDAKLSIAGRTISLTGTWKYPIGTGAIIIEYFK